MGWILDLPPPRSLVFCRMGLSGKTWSECERCPEHVPCNKYTTAEYNSKADRKGLKVSVFDEKQRKREMSKYLKSIGLAKGTVVVH